jgi:hypothetical protein
MAMAEGSGNPQNQPPETPPVDTIPPGQLDLINRTVQSVIDGNLSRLNQTLTVGLRKETDKIPGMVQDLVDRALVDTSARGENYAPEPTGSGSRQRRRAPLYDDLPDDSYGDGGGDDRIDRLANVTTRLVNRLDRRDVEDAEVKAINEKRDKVQTELGRMAQTGGVNDFWTGNVNAEYKRRVMHLENTVDDWDEAYEIGVGLILETSRQRATAQARTTSSAASQRVGEAVESGRQTVQAIERENGVNNVDGGVPSSGPGPRMDALSRAVRRSAVEGDPNPDIEELIRRAKRGEGAAISAELRS